MQNIILFDHPEIHQSLLPLTFTRPTADLRIGILTIREKWERCLPGSYSYLTESYLSKKYPTHTQACNLFVAGHVLPTDELVNIAQKLQPGESCQSDGKVILYKGSLETFQQQQFSRIIELKEPLFCIEMLYDIFLKNDAAIEQDFRRITTGRESAPLSPTNTVIGETTYPDGLPKIFIEEGASVECCFLNLNEGPIYIGKEAELMEGCCIRAPFAACQHAVAKMGCKIYGATTLGPYCKVGGELSNVVMIGYSNKAHDGFLGNAVIGEWCNLGAGTTASNLKNDYAEIKLWHYPSHRFLRTGLQFCGLIMGDHSKAGINCMFNTATVIGVGVNIYGAGFPRNFVASFSEGGTSGFNDVALSKFFATAEKMMHRRNIELTEVDKEIFESIYHQAENFK